MYHTCSDGLPEGPLPQAMLPFRHKLVDNTVCACAHVCLRSVHVEYLNMDTCIDMYIYCADKNTLPVKRVLHMVALVCLRVLAQVVNQMVST